MEGKSKKEQSFSAKRFYLAVVAFIVSTSLGVFGIYKLYFETIIDVNSFLTNLKVVSSEEKGIKLSFDIVFINNGNRFVSVKKLSLEHNNLLLEPNMSEDLPVLVRPNEQATITVSNYFIPISLLNQYKIESSEKSDADIPQKKEIEVTYEGSPPIPAPKILHIGIAGRDIHYIVDFQLGIEIITSKKTVINTTTKLVRLHMNNDKVTAPVYSEAVLEIL